VSVANIGCKRFGKVDVRLIVEFILLARQPAAFLIG
jgi:hypothetical protein